MQKIYISNINNVNKSGGGGGGYYPINICTSTNAEFN